MPIVRRSKSVLASAFASGVVKSVSLRNASRVSLNRPRVGVAVPLDDAGRLTFDADAELFVTLRSANPGGDDGPTGMRTQVGLSYELNDRLSLSAAYLRDQDFEDGRPDTVGHAPIIGMEYSF